MICRLASPVVFERRGCARVLVENLSGSLCYELEVDFPRRSVTLVSARELVAGAFRVFPVEQVDDDSREELQAFAQHAAKRVVP